MVQLSVLARGWREQYDRMLRWFERLHEPGIPDERRRDDYYAFFVICYHLKDWLQKDPLVPASVRKSVEKFIDTSPSLRMCADITNGVKHLVQDNARSVKIDPDARLSAPSAFFSADTFRADAFQVN